MSIQALQTETIRAIASSQVLTDPAAAVKELVDNALDAHSSTVSVEISSNTLDLIHVRDNGHGIAPEDRAIACRRYCTSKIRQYSDLRDIGGSFLGFRGEALACIAELSETMTLATRIEGEEVAAMMFINREGEVTGRERASHPVGTSVRLTGLLNPLPVRKETALKSSSKCLAQIKRMMQAYALARPRIRFSLKILNLNSAKDTWIYAPKANGTVQDAVIKVAGKGCARDCTWSVMKKDNYEIQAFLPTPECNITNISNIGHFVSVDSRPVSACRGTLKQAVGAIKRRLKASNPNLRNLKDPFLWMNIDCPSQSYDLDVEPAKDDVVFDDSDTVLGAVQALLDQFYALPLPLSSSVQSPIDANNIFDGEIEELIASENHQDSNKDNSQKLLMTWTSNMYSDAEEDLPEHSDQARCPSEMEDQVETDSELRDVSVSNPWTIAKIHASNRPRHFDSSIRGQLPTPLQERSSFEINSGRVPGSDPLPSHTIWMTPAPSSSPSPLKRTSSRGEITMELENTPRKRVRDSDSDCEIVRALAYTPPQDKSLDSTPRTNHNRNWREWASLRASAHVLTPNASSSVESLPIRLNAPKQLGKSATNRPFISPTSQKPRKQVNGDKAYHPANGISRRSRQMQHESRDIRTAFFARDLTDAGNTLGSAANNAVSSPRIEPPSSASNTRTPEPPLTNGGIQTVIVTLRTTIATLSSLSAKHHTLNLLLNGADGIDVPTSAWIGPRVSEARLWQDPDAPTSLVQPPVRVDEMKRWKERVLRYLNATHKGDYEGEDVDIGAAMTSHVAGRLCV